MPSGHTPPYIIPPTLALAESSGASGKDLIAALAVGFEIAARMHTTVPYGAFWYDADGNMALEHSGRVTLPRDSAPPRVPVKYFNLDEKKMANALGVSGHLSPVPTWIRANLC